MNTFVRLCLACLLVTTAVAQTTQPAFEVASVKSNKSGDQNSRVGMAPNGRFTATNVTLKSLISNVYNVRSFQVPGGPAWLDSDRFDITATVGHEIKPSPGGPPEELIQMLKNLVADRFKLTVHTESKDMPVFELVIVRADGGLGAKMRPAEVDCAALMARGGPPPVASPGEVPPCSARLNPGAGRLTARGALMSQFTRSLAGMQSVDRLVVDKTGLAGGYDIDLEWTPESSADVSGASLFTALQEQLGLKLQPARGPVEILVIDHVERPTPD